MATLSIQRVTFTYPRADKPTLEDISFTLRQGGFYLLCGPTGSGKSTLLRLLKPELSPVGSLTGERTLDGSALSDLDVAQSARRLGFVTQHAHRQIVTDSVWHELAFGLENIGVPSDEIRRRVGETAQFFGIHTWFEKHVSELSGGQKQLLNLAAILAMQPDILILDEPTAQLDPIASKEFINALTRVNQELGCTVILAEHHLDDVLPLAEEVLFLRDGKLAFAGDKRSFAEFTTRNGDDFQQWLPVATRIGQAIGDNAVFTTKDARVALSTRVKRAHMHLTAAPRETDSVDTKSKSQAGASALSARDVWFRYSRSDEPVLKGVTLDIAPGTIHAIIGGNASGKSTLLTLLAGARAPLRGRVSLAHGERRGLLVQQPQAMFVRDSVLDDLLEVAGADANGRERALRMLDEFGLSDRADSHPYDLSGGELQKAALAKLLLVDPSLILLDEPTKGLDVTAKATIGDLLVSLRQRGKTIVLVTHDLDFVARYADTCSLLFNGAILSQSRARDFFTHNAFYTTSTYRATRGIIEGCVTFNDFTQALEAANVLDCDDENGETGKRKCADEKGDS